MNVTGKHVKIFTDTNPAKLEEAYNAWINTYKSLNVFVQYSTNSDCTTHSIAAFYTINERK